MTGYLQRLVARALPGSGSTLRPFVRSESPIAARDQRIGLPGFEAVGFDELSIASLAEGETPIDPAPAPQPSRLQQQQTDGYGSEISPGAESIAKSPAVARAQDVAAAGSHAEPRVSDVPAPITDHRSFDGRERRAIAQEKPVVEGRVLNARPPRQGEGARHVTHSLPADRLQVQGVRRAGKETGNGRDPPSASAMEPPDGVTWPDSPALEQRSTPRVEIGSIQVEVVPQAPAPQKGASHAQRGPLTAESVSRIGPLAARRRSNLRFAARQR